MIRESAIPVAPFTAGAPGGDEHVPLAQESASFVTSRPASAADRRLAFAAVAVSAVVFLCAIPFAKEQLPQVWAFIPAYQSALVVCDLVTALLLAGQARFSRSPALVALALGYLFTALIAVAHALSFPGLFAPGGLLGAGGQTTAWLYMFWHGGFPLFVIAYVRLSRAGPMQAGSTAVALGAGGVLAATLLATWIASAADTLLPAIMQGNRYTPAMLFVVSSVWLLSLLALLVLWRRRPYAVLDVWLMAVMCAWLFDIGLAAVFNAGRFDLGFYAGRIYGLAAASYVLLVLLVENGALHARLALAHGRHAERLRIVHEIDRAIITEVRPEAIAAAVLQPVRVLLGVARANINLVDASAQDVEWFASAGRHRTHIGAGLRFPAHLIGDVDALRRGQPQKIDTRAQPPGKERDALIASGVLYYVAIPMIAGGELIGALSFGGEKDEFPEEQMAIARDVATQLATAISQARLVERVRRHADELEDKVLERTAELEAANRELESFSYSVSHDLRAPLRAIDGYARMLHEDYVERLDAEGKRLLDVVQANARRMGQLIDDLLAFSRLSRQQPAKERVDMGRLARAVADELSGARTVEVGALPGALADASLVKQVWANLIANALKYSSKKPAARVEIGAREEGSEIVYWVRDNGAGFDMRYAAKLFGVFQRLHGADEFEGTGVGLAIVQRVVSRHGGRVWAEARPGEGACFYFSLPKAA